jgi:hypothetical protein
VATFSIKISSKLLNTKMTFYINFLKKLKLALVLVLFLFILLLFYKTVVNALYCWATYFFIFLQLFNLEINLLMDSTLSVLSQFKHNQVSDPIIVLIRTYMDFIIFNILVFSLFSYFLYKKSYNFRKL